MDKISDYTERWERAKKWLEDGEIDGSLDSGAAALLQLAIRTLEDIAAEKPATRRTETAARLVMELRLATLAIALVAGDK